jgi:hypothetical protein
MSKPLMLSIGGRPEETPAETKVPADPAPAAHVTSTQTASGEASAEIYEILKRHEETLRDLVIEVRLLYHNLPDKERKRLEEQRERTTREVRDNFAGQIRSLEDTIARLRGGR